MENSSLHKAVLLGVGLCLFLLSACNQKQKPTTLQTETIVDSISKPYGKVNCKVKLTIDFPTKGNESLVNAIQEWLADLLESPDSTQLSNIKAITHHYVNRLFTIIEKDYANEVSDFMEELFTERKIKKVYETDQLVTFTVSDYSYWGGAHGSAQYSGVTFRKSDGKLLGMNMLRKSADEMVGKLIVKGLLKYFNVSDWATLKPMLFDNGNISDHNEAIDLPAQAPFVVNDSLYFIYQQYEIAPYSAGMPEAHIALKDLKGILSPSFVKTLKK